jgi:abequosyltransferase
MYSPFVSICIPSYNRTRSLLKLLNSIDCVPSDVNVIICEDMAPKRYEVRSIVTEYTQSSPYTINYYENSTNLGFDGNLRRLVQCATGCYILFMGDDDLFVPRALDRFITFLKCNSDKPYVLRSYLTEHNDGRTEYFRYLPKSQVLPPGEATVAWLFKRSVSLCGFTISREKALQYSTTALDGTLLYQVYLMAQVCLMHSSVYCDIPFTHAVQSFRDDNPMFGNSQAEKNRYTPGKVSHDNSINFAKAYFELSEYLDAQHGTKISRMLRLDLSKYSYPFLSIQRKRGIISFLHYAKRLEVEVGLGCTAYFFIYKWTLVILGERICDQLILAIKRTIGHTPNF